MTAPKSPQLSLLDEVVAAHVLQAMRVASSQLSRLGVRHSLIGGLAVGAWGYPRATKKVSFLVGAEAYEHHVGELVTMKPGVPIRVKSVPIDFLSPGSDEPRLARSLDNPTADSVPVAPIEVLIELKLKSPRQKDRADIVELIKAGIDTASVDLALATGAPHLVAKWQLALATARDAEASS